ncbi:MAG: tRNA (N6-isopentenyl adenosine(37)-C2)-methylthiotransferase MiaB [Planctomycetaceae bacterium]|nr:tRNA (N6-isopentenyl adenosine(37)-C2)-methylthiotransferase MiaB [Planctomycetaceae bacterium]
MSHDHNKKLFIETVGCQMNMLDSELVVAALRKDGYELTRDVALADTVLFNTCSVREHAEHKIYSALGRLKHSKTARPNQVIGVIGCMAQKDQNLIFRRAPHVDLVVGTGQLAQIPELIEASRHKREQRLAVSLDRRDATRREVSDSFQSYDPLRDPEMRPSPFQAFVRIQIGCDKFCTYCVVPMTRGPEQGRPPRHILHEVRKLADEGVQEVTLLGQTVNSYRHTEDGRSWRLSDLLAAMHDTPGLERIKFVTNFPRDMSDDLLQAVRDLPKVARYLHVPAQSGCNDILKRMKRGYTIEQYREMFGRIRATMPDCAVSSDFIVGFCGESEESFRKSVDLIRECRFKNSFIFKYSPRPGTKADELLPDDVPEEVKRRRNNELLAVQNAISEEDNAALIGRDFEVLVEGLSKAALKDETRSLDDDHPQLVGRTRCDRIVVFEGNPRLVGSLTDVHVYDCSTTTLIGTIVTREHQHGATGLLPILA